jgi:intein/homing endonuclease
MASKPVYVARPGLRSNGCRHGRSQHLGQATSSKQLADPVSVYWDDEVGMIHSPEWIEVSDKSEPELEFIGLYDHDGDPLYRVNETVPIGFHHRDES